MKENKYILETNRLRLRELVNSDLDDVMKMFSDETTMRFWPRVRTREEGIAWIAEQKASYAANGCGYWACELRDSGDFVGQVGLLKQEVDGQPELQLSYLFVPEHSIGGYAGEISRGCMTYGFEKYKVQQIIALIRPDNESAVRTAQRIGMTLGKTTTHKDALHGIWSVKKRG